MIIIIIITLLTLIGLLGHDLLSLGIPTEDDLVSLYCSHTGLVDIPNWNFYKSFTFFRVAAILQGVYKRAQQSLYSVNTVENL